ncbi:hypothetical protein [Caulobacter hibisci]|uniref:Energy transducer TonB n=1 Tax=Caulobacter hibisci TaxID=2035993 RepID=A0ABS0T3R3_9CAUL|nr:hypothetical protein [Caulobacter hibisci]MBI1685528.1 hypothetical protein [Caulobacter hibisci]
MTTLERPLPLPLVVVLLSAVSVVGFVMGLRGVLDTGKPADAVSTAPLAEVSGVPIKDALPAALEVEAPPPPPPAPKAEETAPTEAAAAAPPVIEAPPAPVTPAPAEKKPEVPPAQQAPQRIEDLY